MSRAIHLGYPSDRGKYAPSEHGFASFDAAIKAAARLNFVRISKGDLPYVVLGEREGDDIKDPVELPRMS